MTNKERVDEWELIGSGTVEDPYRPDVFDDEDDDTQYHFDADSETLYKIVQD